MTGADSYIKFRPREFKGSRLRCLLLTSDAPTKIADFITSLVAPHALVTTEDRSAPRGFLLPDEAKLGKSAGYLPERNPKELTRCWLANPSRANTPNWDIVSTCHVDSRVGLILIEAKARQAELADDACGATNAENVDKIKGAIDEASAGWNVIQSGFALSAISHYQLSNRFAFAWKLATVKVPVILVYLGFVKEHEMENGGVVQHDAEWRRCVLKRSKGTIPKETWNTTFDVGGRSSAADRLDDAVPIAAYEVSLTCAPT